MVELAWGRVLSEGQTKAYLVPLNTTDCGSPWSSQKVVLSGGDHCHSLA